MASSTPAPESPGSNRFVGRTIEAVSDRASRILTRGKDTSFVFKYSLDTVTKIVSPATTFTAGKWEAYGDPLIASLDKRIDNALTLFTSARANFDVGDDSASTSSSATLENAVIPTDSKEQSVVESGARDAYLDYWRTLKEQFVKSRWYTKVDEILLQNTVVLAFTQRVVRPAEMFYNTVTEEFVQNGSREDYMTAVRARLGPSWDERLDPLARAFYATAQAVQSMVGAGKLVGGALQLGRAKMNERVSCAIDEILDRWDRVLTLTDDAIDRWLPDADLRLPAPRRRKGSSSGDWTETGTDTDTTDTDTDIDIDQGVFEMDEDLLKLDKERSKRERIRGRSPTLRARPRACGSRRHVKRKGNHVAGSELYDVEPAEDAKAHESVHLAACNGHCEEPASASDTSARSEADDERTDEDDGATPLEPVAAQQDPTATRESTSTDKRVSPVATRAARRSRLHAKRHRSLGPIATKLGSRLRQRITGGLPSVRCVRTLGEHLRTQLADSAWFARVDEILMQNALIRALSQTVHTSIVRPAEHFFNTALQLLVAHLGRPPPLAEFVGKLRARLGSSWDDRLVAPTESFLTAADRAQEPVAGLLTPPAAPETSPAEPVFN